MKHYIIWIEGLEPKTGEKIKSITEAGVVYTTKMGNAMRIRENDIPKMKDYLSRNGFAQWVIEGATFIRTSYVPKGTLYRVP